MMHFWKSVQAVLLLALLGGCATTETNIGAPSVRLDHVSVSDFDVKAQTFVLNFSVTNPNPFDLEITNIRYGVRLDGQRFASGDSRCQIDVPAGSEGQFEITVDLNLLKTAPDLLFTVRDGVKGEIPYDLAGRFEVNLPLNPKVDFENSGSIQFQAALH